MSFTLLNGQNKTFLLSTKMLSHKTGRNLEWSIDFAHHWRSRPETELEWKREWVRRNVCCRLRRRRESGGDLIIYLLTLTSTTYFSLSPSLFLSPCCVCICSVCMCVFVCVYACKFISIRQYLLVKICHQFTRKVNICS